MANAMEKISNTLNVQFRLTVLGGKDHDSTMKRVRYNGIETEEILDKRIIDEPSQVDFKDLIYRIARGVERINTNLELQLHMMLANKNRAIKHFRHAGEKTRRGSFEWLHNLLYGKKKPDRPKAKVDSTATLYDMLTTKYDVNTESELLEAAYRIGYGLERINSNLELQLRMRLDCNCEKRRRFKRNYGTLMQTTTMARNLSDDMKNYQDNNLLNNINVRRRRNVALNSSVLETTAATILRTVDEPDDVKITKVPLAVTTETIVEKKEEQKKIPKISRRQQDDGVKIKLLNYIYESYNEIINKIDPLSKVKTQYQNENIYKIGYIMSNIDTLEVNLKNMKKDVDTNKHNFDETKILNVLDTFMASNRIVTSLIESLKILDKNVDIERTRPTTLNPNV